MNNLATIIKKSEQSFTKKAPEGMQFDKEAFFAMQLLSKNSFSVTTAQKNPDSLMSAMINVAAVGLSLNPANQDAYLVPRDGVICLDISYKGLIKLATNTGSIKWVQAEIVYDSDEFQFNGVGEKPLHKSDPFRERGAPMGVYCVAKTADGDYLTTIMSASEVEEVRLTSKAATGDKPQYSPWSTFPMEMWRKSCIKRASKTWPKTDVNGSDNLTHAIDVLNEHEGLQEAYTGVSKESADYYATLIKNGDSFGLYVFFNSLEIEQQVRIENDYISANAEPRGKGKLKTAITELKEAGKSTAFEYRDSLDHAADESLMLELIAELSDDEYTYIFDILSTETKARISDIQEAIQ